MFGYACANFRHAQTAVDRNRQIFNTAAAGFGLTKSPISVLLNATYIHKNINNVCIRLKHPELHSMTVSYIANVAKCTRHHYV